MAGGGESRFRFELTRLELAGVVVSTVASLFIVFLLGVYAGRGMGGGRADEAERVVRLPVAPAVVEETPGAEDLTFDDTLGDDERPARGGAAGAHAAAAADRGALAAADTGAAVGARERRTGSERGAESGRGAVSERDTGGERGAASEDGAADAAHGGAGARAGVAHLAPQAPPTPQRSPEARVAVALAAPRASASPPAAALPPSSGGAWSVQVTATREPRTADDLVKRLRARGYEAYIVRARREGATFYRVRVGHYPSMEHASQMVSRLRREPGVPEAFVASD